MSNYRLIVGAAVVPLVLLACGSVEDSMREALENDQVAQVCLRDGELGLKMLELKNGQSFVKPSGGETAWSFGRNRQLAKRGEKVFAALVKANYVVDEPRTVSVRVFGSTNRVKTHAITDEGKKFLASKEAICVGKREIEEILTYSEPANRAGFVVSVVKFTYDIDYNDHAKRLGLEEIVEAMPEYASGRAKAMLAKTSNGWEVKGGIMADE